MIKLLTALVTLSFLASAQAQDFNPQELRSRTIERRAVEALVWGMPAVNYDLMLQEALKKTSVRQNEIVYWSRPVDWKNQTLTPNPDALYFMIFFNTKEAGPIVIDVPPADGGSFAANIDTVWQMPLEDAGPYGADQGKGGKYLILPPGYREKPPDGYIAVQSQTFAGYALFRSNLVSHADADVAKAETYGKRLKVYPLSQAATPQETKFTDAKEVLYDSTIPYDLRFFQSLDRIVQSEPWLTRDKAMIDPLKSIGIEKGKAFTPDAETTEILNRAAVEARAFLDRNYEIGFPPFFPTTRWAVPAFSDLVKAGSSGYAEADIYPVDARALTYSIGYIGIKRLGTAQTYLITSKDEDGAQLEGDKSYRLHVPPNVPVELYWSVTAYDRETHALIKNLDRASRASNAAELQKNTDGSVDIWFGPKAPAGKEVNWVPTDPQRGFELLFRLYGPKKELFEKLWVLPDVEKVAVQ
ncbi:hypothetical protein QBD01_001663 [Ochrobactrum sp. 19YEA23]|uniref:DUF1254 domain-containing protein n=1 Tax=Ochrobactrum sp. 19YEA23 TaxID=3039854 RepID=UPI00247A8F62|nr:hypothetical protein [Ochrobactrum sp. 19YEA23]